ncbi:class I SAM-dependent methyltransferase [Egicoccus sp. AB-alg2]|uniref:class I SAM-dependent methyltransferase n=1 Tax=Egicoccus sp. AB-alg2 TaxID=3242693 RepID=UPI00359EC1FA
MTGITSATPAHTAPAHTTPADTTPADTTPAHTYDDYYGPAIFGPLGRALLAFAPPSPGDRVLDVACGTGIVTRRLAAAVGPGGEVTGIDLNPAMLAVARERTTATAATVAYRQGDATTLDLPDRSVDRVYCQQGLQFFPDRLAAVREMRRVLVDGGRVALAVWQGLERHSFFAALARAEAPHLAAHGLPVETEDLVAPFTFGDAAALTGLLREAGLRVHDVATHTVTARFVTPERFVERLEHAYAAVVPKFDEDPDLFADYLAAIEEETRALVEEYRVGDHVVVPMHTNLVVAER